jgi:beta-lactamase superfamily II metal-dependent hydrolase
MLAVPGLVLPASAQSGDNNLTIVYLDVGQGDSTIIRMPNGKAMLIDGGEREQTQTILNTAADLDVKGFDVVVATHPHADHIGGLIEVFNKFPVGRVLDSGQFHTTKTFEDYLTAIEENKIPYAMAQEGDTIDLDPSVELRILNPPKTLPFGSHDPDQFNNNSVVVKLTYGEFTAIFPGDIEQSTEKRLASSDIDVDVLLASHHGSRYSNTAPYLAAASPEAMIIYSGADNIYGYPHTETLERISKLEPVLFRTDVDGHIKLVANQTHYRIETSATDRTVVVPEFQDLVVISLLPIAAIIVLTRRFFA